MVPKLQRVVGDGRDHITSRSHDNPARGIPAGTVVRRATNAESVPRRGLVTASLTPLGDDQEDQGRR